MSVPSTENVPVPVEQFLEGFPRKIRALVMRVRGLVRRAVPDHRERVYTGWNLIGYRVIKGSKSFYFGYIAPFEDKVVLGFEHGKMLSDPEGLLRGSGSQVRFVPLRKSADVQAEKLLPLILEASAIAGEKKSIVRQKKRIKS